MTEASLPFLPGNEPGGFGRFTCHICGGRTKYLPHNPAGNAYASAVWACLSPAHVLVWKWAEEPTSWRRDEWLESQP